MPTNIARFEFLMYLSLTLSIVATATNESFLAVETRAFTIGGLLFNVAFTVLFTWLIARRGANWARWTYAVLFGLGAPFLVIAIPMVMLVDPVAGVVTTIQVSLQTIAVVLIFTGDARDWFGSRATA